MKILNNKTKTTLLSLILLTTIAIPLLALPAATAHSPPWRITTYAYVSVVPPTVGVGQRVIIVMWAYLKMPQATIDNPVRMQNYMLNITKPDGSVETRGPFTPDPTQSIYTTYTPTQAGNYALDLWYPDTIYVWNDTAAMRIWTNDTFLGATSKTVTFTVQQQQLPEAIASYPFPTEYWTRPIEGQNTYWFSLSSNWLGNGSPQIYDSSFQQDGTGPNSAHVMWTKPIQDGGIVGGSEVGIPGNGFYTGQTYNQRFPNPIIMTGRLFYREPFRLNAQAGDTVCVDLRTGQEIWRRSDLPTLSFGYTYDAETPNQKGVLYNGILFSNNFAQAFDPRTGNLLFNVTGVPSAATSAYGPQGEILRYTLSNLGNATRQNYYLAQWNSSRLWDMSAAALTAAITDPANASTPDRYDWNVSAPWRNGMTGTVSVLDAFLGDVMLGINGTLSIGDPNYVIWGGWNNGTPNPYTMWAISLKPETLGQVLWMKTYTPPGGPDLAVLVWPQTVDPTTRVFTMYMKDTMDLYGYNLDTGNQIWGPVGDSRAFDSFTGSVNTENTGSHRIAYGNLYRSGYGGILTAINMTTGKVEWTYGNGGAGNSTASPFGTVWGNFPLFIAGIADSKVYLFNNEHSPTLPLYKGSMVRAVDAYTGKEIWKLMSWGDGGAFVAQSGAIADGYYVYDNMYDMQIYSIGKGPSATTVTAPDLGIALGGSALIRGTVTDISAGTKQNEQAARFPNGVPAVSDDSQSDWMAYVYMQKPRPTNVKGVDVKLSMVDPNNNTYDIGTATSDANGMFKMSFTPQVPGEYTILATFEGSNSYWPSRAETAILVVPAPSAAPTATPAPSVAPTLTPTATPASPSPSAPVPPSGISTTAMYLIAIAAVVIIAVIAAAVVLRRRK